MRIFLAFVFLISVCLCKSQQDTIFTNFKTIPCKLQKVTELTVDYVENNERKSIAREKIKRIAAHSFDLPVTRKSRFVMNSGDSVFTCKIKTTVHTFPAYKEYISHFEIMLQNLLSKFDVFFTKKIYPNDTVYFMDVHYHEPIMKNLRDTTYQRVADLDTLVCYTSSSSGKKCFNDFVYSAYILRYVDPTNQVGVPGIIKVPFSATGYYYEPRYHVKMDKADMEAIIKCEITDFFISQFHQKLSSKEVIRLRDTFLCLLKASGT